MEIYSTFNHLASTFCLDSSHSSVTDEPSSNLSSDRFFIIDTGVSKIEKKNLYHSTSHKNYLHGPNF